MSISSPPACRTRRFLQRIREGWLAFTLRGRPLAFVRLQLSLICQLLATIGDPLPLISDVISSGRKQFASS
jgi:hypothetical protein